MRITTLRARHGLPAVCCLVLLVAWGLLLLLHPGSHAHDGAVEDVNCVVCASLNAVVGPAALPDIGPQGPSVYTAVILEPKAAPQTPFSPYAPRSPPRSSAV